LLSRIAEHDIGFAGEMKHCRSRDLTVTNKILQYLLAGIAVVAGNMADPSGDVDAVPCAPTRPISVLIIHGSDDRNVPVEGGTSADYPDQVSYAPLSDVVRRWRRSNGCTKFAQVRQEGDVTVRRWEGDAPVELRLVVGGGHEWFPGAGTAIADFFAGLTRTV